VTAASFLISSQSAASSELVSGVGPSVRSIGALGTMKGRTFPAHGEGSFAKLGGVGRQTPGGRGDEYGVGAGPKRPSFIRLVSIALAVASPITIPAAFDPGGLSGRAAMYAS